MTAYLSFQEHGILKHVCSGTQNQNFEKVTYVFRLFLFCCFFFWGGDSAFSCFLFFGVMVKYVLSWLQLYFYITSVLGLQPLA